MNFLLISIDSWRYDALGRINDKITTPKFDCLTEHYMFSQNLFSTAPATRSAHTSLFTGLYPFEHGLYGQGYLRTFKDIPNLFQLFINSGYTVLGRSQKKSIFRFLDIDQFLVPYDSNVQNQSLGSLEELINSILRLPKDKAFCFLHFWDAHLPYGQDLIPTAPNIRILVQNGKREEAIRFYYAAVNHVLEYLIVEVLKRISLDDWAVFIFGDHGDGFCPEVVSHGTTLHEQILRVPLLIHIPGEQAPSLPFKAMSTIDLFSTILTLSETDHSYKGYGLNLLDPYVTAQDRWVLSELDTTYGVSFLSKSFTNTNDSEVTSRNSIGDKELERSHDISKMWSVSNGNLIFIESENTHDYILRDVNTGVQIPCDDPIPYRDIYNGLVQNSVYRGYFIE